MQADERAGLVFQEKMLWQPAGFGAADPLCFQRAEKRMRDEWVGRGLRRV